MRLFSLWLDEVRGARQRMPFADRDALKDAVKDILGGLGQETCARSCHSIVNQLQVLNLRSHNGHHIEQLDYKNR